MYIGYLKSREIGLNGTGLGIRIFYGYGYDYGNGMGWDGVTDRTNGTGSFTNPLTLLFLGHSLIPFGICSIFVLSHVDSHFSFW